MRTRRWLSVYFLLAAFDIAAVSISLYLNHLIVSRYAESIEVNRDWADRQGIYASLGQLAATVNTPGNDVFATGDIDAEEARLAARAEDFRVRLREARRELVLDIDPADAGPLLDLLDRSAQEMEAAVASGLSIFDALRAGDAHAAGQRMAAMDRRYNRARDYLTELDARVRLIQRRTLDAQAAAAADLRRFEFLVGAFIVLMVVGVTAYGRLLVRQTHRAARERERYLAEIAGQRARLEAVFRTAAEGILTVRPDGAIESANPAAGAIIGVEPGDLAGRPVRSLLAPDAPIPDAPGVAIETVGRRGDGRAFPLEVALSAPAPAPGGGVTTWIIRDISERKRIESELAEHRDHLERLVEARTAELEDTHARLRASERLASIGTLGAGLGHDMKNLLFPMRCRLDALDRLDLPDPARAELAQIRAGLDYLQNLSRGLRLLSLDPEDPEASGGVTDIARWWDEVGALIERSLPAGARFTARIDRDSPPVRVAPHMLTQAVLNLVVNAGDALGAAPGDVGLTVRHTDRTVTIRVEDTGRGMTREVRDRALEPFFTTKQRGLSTGMGLSLVHAVALAAHGSLRIDSEPGAGTTIDLTLPVGVNADPDAQADSPASPAGAVTAVVSVRDARLGAFASAVLRAAGARVIRASALNGFTSPAVWVTDRPDPAQRDRFLAADRRNRIVSLAADIDPTPGLIRADDAGRTDRFRRILAEALSAAAGAGGETPT